LTEFLKITITLKWGKAYMNRDTGKGLAVIGGEVVLVVLFLVLLPVILKIVLTVLGIVLIVFLTKKIMGR
jgi:hypothetical protein